jgi:hypothetical protein
MGQAKLKKKPEKYGPQPVGELCYCGKKNNPIDCAFPTCNGRAALKLDLGCGQNKQVGFTGVDRRQFPGVDQLVDLTKTPWPWPSDSVEEVHCSHFLEHLDHNTHNPQRVRFMNELYRVMKVGAKASIVTPHWCSNRAYGDFTHADKPVSEMFYYYLSKKWRKENAPDNDIEWNPDGYSCDFEATWGYGMRADLTVRNQEYQQFAFANYKEAAQDLWATLVKLG